MLKNRILFVDDEPKILEALKRMLKKHAVEWEMAFISDPLEARAAFKSTSFEVVVSDIQMPKLKGLDLVKELRAMDDNVQFIMLTGTADFENAIEAINELGVLRFYTKPCPAARLADGVQAALRRAELTLTCIRKFGRDEAALNRISVGVIVTDAAANVIFMVAAEFVDCRSITVKPYELMITLHALIRDLTDGNKRHAGNRCSKTVDGKALLYSC